MNLWHDVTIDRITKDDFLAVIEISKGSKNKYELDKDTGTLILDRILYTSTHYPASYGFIPKTYADDNDPLDVLVLCSENIAPLAMVRCYPIGVIEMKDDGFYDYKVIAIPFNDPTWNCHKRLEDIPQHILKEIRHFFNVYKELEYKHTVVMEIYSKEKAVEIVQEAIDYYKAKF